MFLRRYTRTKDGKTHTYYGLVESVRTEAGPPQHVGASLGELNHDQERPWQRTVVFPHRQGEDKQLRLFPHAETPALPDDPDILRIRLNSVGWTNPRRFGDVWLGWGLWKFLHLDEIIGRYGPQAKETARPADIGAIEVVNRWDAPCSQFALAEPWDSSSGLEDRLGVPDDAVTKDRLDRTWDRLLKTQEAIEDDLKDRLGTLFQLDYDLWLYDLTSTYFEGLAEENDRARRGYSRDPRSDCQQIVLGLIVTRDGLPLAHLTLAGHTQDLQTVETSVTTIEDRFGKSQRVWVLDRGMTSVESLRFLSRSGRRYLLAPRRGELTPLPKAWPSGGWKRLKENPDVAVKLLQRKRVPSVLARSRPRRQKEGAIRRRPRRGLARGLGKLQQRIEDGRLKNRAKLLESVGRLQGCFPKARPFVTITVPKTEPPQVQWSWNREKFRVALGGDEAYLLRSNQDGWSATEFWETYIQWTVVEPSFGVLKSELRLRPVWPPSSGRTQAQVMIWVLAYALWKTLDPLAQGAGLKPELRKPDPGRPKASPKSRPMTPEVILRELGKIALGDILLETTEGQNLSLGRVARPSPEQKRILEALRLESPERLSPDRVL